MRRLVATALIVIGAAALVLGQLGNTVWAPAPQHRATVELSDPGSAVLIDPGVPYMGGTEGTLQVSGTKPVHVIPASKADATAYLGSARYTRITGASSWTELTSQVVNPKGDATVPAPESTDLFGAPAASPTTKVSTPIGSLWAADGGARPARPYRALLIVTDGHAPGATSVTITWPRSASNAWVPYAFVIGALLAVAGLVLFLVDFRARRDRSADPTPVTGRRAARTDEETDR